MNKEEIIGYNIPTACPLVFEFDQDLTPLKNYYLIDEQELKERQEAVANQAKAKLWNFWSPRQPFYTIEDISRQETTE